MLDDELAHIRDLADEYDFENLELVKITDDTYTETTDELVHQYEAWYFDVRENSVRVVKDADGQIYASYCSIRYDTETFREAFEIIDKLQEHVQIRFSEDLKTYTPESGEWSIVDRYNEQDYLVTHDGTRYSIVPTAFLDEVYQLD